MLETRQSLQDEIYLFAYSHHPKQLNRFRQMLPLPPNVEASIIKCYRSYTPINLLYFAVSNTSIIIGYRSWNE